MRWLFRVFYVLFFFLAIGFAIKNAEVISINWFLGWQSQTPLVLALFVSMLVGVLLGVLGMLGYWFRAKREITRLRKMLPVDEIPADSRGAAAVKESGISVVQPPYLS